MVNVLFIGRLLDPFPPTIEGVLDHHHKSSRTFEKWMSHCPLGRLRPVLEFSEQIPWRLGARSCRFRVFRAVGFRRRP
jgi:hypothetical protein